MLFDKPVYILFLALVVALYWRLPWRAQNVFLLAASYFFYGWWDWRFLCLMTGSTVVDYYLALGISRSPTQTRRRTFMVVSLVMNFGFLGIFKYFNFFADSFGTLAHGLGFTDVSVAVLQVILPPGISFYTFQAVAYIVDIYRGKMVPARSLLDYALFISLFPHLIAGPIQRPTHLLPQVESPRRLDYTKVFAGLMLIVTGLFRKLVVADNCALIANGVFRGDLGTPTLPLLLLGVYAFAWQIYGDFSGYSDIARGSAQLLGFHFMLNFRQPYLATSLQDFWRRWHISLSTWLRDYLYIPLGGSRQGERRTYVNLLVTMLLGGLWHGANWTFVVWGGIHGSGLAGERWLGGDREASVPVPSRITCWVRRVLVFHFVCFAWLFFRVSSLSDAVRWLEGAGTIAWNSDYTSAAQFLVLFAVPLFLLDLRLERHGEEYPFETVSGPVTASSYWRPVAFATCGLALLALFAASQPNAFIYFRF
jgi:alginate O-acetyltransferase complex protein AlgI